LARPLRDSRTKRAWYANQSSLPPPATSSVCSSALAPPDSALAETPWTEPCGIPAALPRMPDRSCSARLPPLRSSLKLRAGSAFTASILVDRQPAVTHPALAAQEVACSYQQRGSSLPWHRDRQRAPPHWQPRRLPRRQLVTSPSFQPSGDSIATPFSPSRRMPPPHSPFNSRRAPLSPHDPTSAGSYRTEPHSDQLGDYSRRKHLHRRHFVSISRQRPQPEQIPR
jgi:hypothetical protein